MFIASLFTIVRRWKQPKFLTPDEKVNKLWYIYTHSEYYSAIKGNAILIHATTWMNPENILSERSQTQNATHCMIPFA